MEHLPIHNLSVEQVKLAKEHCLKCPFWTLRTTYDFNVFVCEKYQKTDSFIFLVNRCAELKERLGL